jgi:hypothetical protein
MKRVLKIFALAGAAVLFLGNAAFAGSIIGNWSGSSRSWNDGDMATLKATMITAGHTVEADEAITGPNLSNDDLFVIGEPTSTPTIGELGDLQAWVTGGGILLMFADSGGTGLPALNNIAAGIGSSLAWGGSASSNPPLAGGNFATDGPPFNIVGQALDISPGTAVAGGTSLTGDYLRYQQVGLGFVFGFADRSDHNVFAPTNANTNGQLFLNLAAGGSGQPVPEPTTLSLTGLGLAYLIRKRGQRR